MNFWEAAAKVLSQIVRDEEGYYASLADNPGGSSSLMSPEYVHYLRQKRWQEEKRQ